MMFTFFTLLMFPGALSFSVIGYTGGAVTITCQYDRGYRRNMKYFCRRKEVFIQKCSDVIRTNIKDKWFEDGKFSLYDDTTASVFNVTITDLNEQDSDTCYCAVDRSFIGDIYTEVKLNVTKETTRSRPSLTTTTSSSSSLCLSSVQSALVTSASPATSSDTLLIVSLSVALILIITGVLTMTVMLCKRHQIADADSDCKISHSGPGIYELVTHDYDEIGDIRHMTDFESASITDFNAEQLPTVPSDAPNAVYYTTQLPTIPSDASNTVYNTHQLPTIPSDASNTVYAAPR